MVMRVPALAFERLEEYQTRLTAIERSVIERSPLVVPPDVSPKLAPWPAVLDMSRYELHMMLPTLKHKFASQPNLHVDPDFFGLALKIGAFELRNKVVTGWPGFALLMHKLLGDAAIPWLPSLFLAAVALPEVDALDFDLSEVLEFRDVVAFR